MNHKSECGAPQHNAANMLVVMSTSRNWYSVTGEVDVVILRARRSKVRFWQMQVIPPELQTHVNTTIRRHDGEAWKHSFKTMPFGYRGAMGTNYSSLS